MPKISLRAYDREIEGLIEHGQRLDEAIAHCRHILKTFPKHLETYRLLGKAYLEGKRYDQAVDIFQRVLMAAPEDFVSHVGMSIIADDRGKLDEAIWHMERAFEVQPSNAAIQGELQRLFGRRDGVEPTRIRLTRGALARMYVQGELYNQAISEIRAVLGQDPKRTDLQILLAQAYFRSGQKAEAADACAALLKVYPYCLDANRLMVEILPAAQRAESVAEYRKRVNDLDPYAAFAQESVFHTESVPDGQVSLDRLEYTGQAADEGAVLGIASAPSSSAMGTLSRTPGWSPGRSGGRAPTVAPALSGDDLPDFMRNAGWKPTNGASTDSGEASPSGGEYEQAAAPGDLPAWVKALAPAEEAEGAVDSSQSTDSIPDWFQSGDAGGAAENVDALRNEAGSELPDWLQRLGDSDLAGTLPPTKAEESGMAADVSEASGGMPPESQTSAEEQAGWLKDFEPDLDTRMQTPAAAEPPLVPESAKAEAGADLGALGTTAQEQDDAMAWLEGLAARHGAKPEELITDPEARKEAAPDWVDKARDAGAQAADGWTPLGPLAPAEPAGEDEYAGLWREDNSVSQEQPTSDAAEGKTEKQPSSDWLSDLSDKDAFAALGAEGTPEEAPIMGEAEAPGWLSNLEPQAVQPSPVGTEPAWMGKSEEAIPQQTASAESASKESGSGTDLPEWLAGLDNEPSGPPSPAVSSEAAPEALPAWLQSEAEAEPRVAARTHSTDWQPAAVEAMPVPDDGEVKSPLASTSAAALADAAKLAAEREARAPIPSTPITRLKSGAGAARSDVSSLGGAQSELGRGNIAAALDIYGRLIRKGRSLEDIIRDLRDALYRYPVEVPIWQALGDAYMRANRLQEALDAYTKAEELLR